MYTYIHVYIYCRITVEFNVNNTVSAVDDEEDDGGSKQAAEPTPPEVIDSLFFYLTDRNERAFSVCSYEIGRAHV